MAARMTNWGAQDASQDSVAPKAGFYGQINDLRVPLGDSLEPHEPQKKYRCHEKTLKVTSKRLT